MQEQPWLWLQGSWWSRAAAVQSAGLGAAGDVPKLDGTHCIQTEHRCRAGLTRTHPPPNLSLVLLLFCSLCLTNAVSWVFLLLFLISTIILMLLLFLFPPPRLQLPLSWIPNAPQPPARPCSHSGGSVGILPHWLPCLI